MVTTNNRHIHKDFKLDIDSYRSLKHKYEFCGICEMPVKWHKAINYNIFDFDS